jgi:hypothetical protein
MDTEDLSFVDIRRTNVREPAGREEPPEETS